MAEEVSTEQARAQAWEMMLLKAREVQRADPSAAAAAKTLLGDPAWEEIIKAGVTAATATESVGEAVSGLPNDEKTQPIPAAEGTSREEPGAPAATAEETSMEELILRYLIGEDVLSPDMLADIEAAVGSGSLMIEERLGT